MTSTIRLAAGAALLCAFTFLGSANIGRASGPDTAGTLPSLAPPPTNSLSNATNPPLVPAVTPPPVTVPAPAPAEEAQSEDRVAYPTLDAAVAAQAMPTTLDGELRCMATAIYFEAKGEPLAGQLAVAQVILNRTRSGRFPRGICSVVTQPGQFSFVRRGVIQSPPVNAAYRRAVAVAKVALDEAWESPVQGALYFHATYVAPGWSRAKVAAIGRHIFYR